MRTRLLALILAFGGVLTLAGCAGKESGPEREGILTGVFGATEYPLSDGWIPGRYVTPRYDPESGEFICLLQKMTETENEDGTVAYVRSQCLAALTPEGVQSMRDTAEFGNVCAGTLANGEIILVTSGEDDRTSVLRISEDGSGILAQADITDPIRGTQTLVQAAASDGAGNIYVVTDEKIVGFDADFRAFLTVTAAGMFGGISVQPDGTLWAEGYFAEGYGIAEIDRETQNLGEIRLLPDGAKEVTAAGDSLYYIAGDGIYRLNVPKKGTPTGEKSADFLNSDIDPDSVLLLMSDGDTVFLSEPDANGKYRPVLCRRAADVDLSAVTVIELAHSSPLPICVRSSITAFNRANPDMRVVVKDYTAYSTNDDPWGGARQLAFELSAGTARPDLVVGDPETDDILWLLRQGAFVDLRSYLRSDDRVREDNVFGCVKTTYSTAEGELFALPLYFEVSTLIGAPEVLGPWAGRESWTFGDLLDFAAGLPEDASLAENLNVERAEFTLLGAAGYGQFVDRKRGICSFDSPDFIRWLDFLASLPTFEKMRRFSDDENTERRLTGKVALARADWNDVDSYIARRAVFGTEETALIGYPTAGPCGTAVEADTVFMIPSFSENPDAGWAFIRSCFIDAEEGFGWDWWTHSGFPTLKTTFDRYAQSYYNTVFARYYSGSGGSFPYDPENPPSAGDLREPGILARFTEEDAAKMKTMLDEIGMPAVNGVPAEIAEIVEEEISVFLGGASSAEDCAKKIQSRAGIWLSEHQ